MIRLLRELLHQPTAREEEIMRADMARYVEARVHADARDLGAEALARFAHEMAPTRGGR